MSFRARLLFSVLLLLAGFFGALIVWALGPRTEADWQARVRTDAQAWMSFLRPDAKLVEDPREAPEFWDMWQAARKDYDEAHMAELRACLHAYLDFLVSEHADAAEIWSSGNDRVLSDEARQRRERLVELLGPIGEGVVEQSDEVFREGAYRDSPTHGLDPGGVDYNDLYEATKDWVGRAHGVVDEHVTVP